jgi:hypothetical protein
MASSTLLPLARTPTNPPTTHRAHTPAEGSYEAVCATAAVMYELEALLADLQAAGLPSAIVSKRLDAARAAHYAANDTYLAPLSSFPCK